MAFDTFIKIGDIEGEAVRVGEKGSIELEGFNWGAHNAAQQTTSSGGPATGKGEPMEFSFMKSTDTTSPTLWKYCLQGKHIPKATVNMYKAGGDKSVNFYKVEFSDVFITSYNVGGSAGGSDVPSEQVTFVCRESQVTHVSQNIDGTPGNTVVENWDTAAVDKQ